MIFLKKCRYFVLFVCLIALAGCETIHTGILGDIPTGMKPLGAMEKGELYEDPQNRFTVIVPDERNLVPKPTPEGIVFIGKNLDRGDLIYAVLIYPMPYKSLSDNDTLKATLDGIQYKIKEHGYDVDVIHQTFLSHDGHAAMDVYYDVVLGSFTRQLYVARFVKVDDKIVNMYYSNGSAFSIARKDGFEKEHIDKYFLSYAETLYEGVTFSFNN